MAEHNAHWHVQNLSRGHQRIVDEVARDRLLAVAHELLRKLADQDPMQTFQAALEAGRFT